MSRNNRNIGISLFLLCCLGLTLSDVSKALSETFLQAKAKKTWTIESAREEVFKGAKAVIDTWGFPAIDPNYSSNKVAIAKKQSKIEDRLITVFSAGGYAVTSKCNPMSSYYSAQGALYLLEFSNVSEFSDPKTCPESFPYKRFRHEYPSGKLIQLSISVSDADDYLYNADGALINHWVKNKCFDLQGSDRRPKFRAS